MKAQIDPSQINLVDYTDLVFAMTLEMSGDNNGESNLHWAAYEGDISLIQEILRKGEKVGKSLINTEDEEGFTPLFWALSSINPEKEDIGVVEYLILNGADVNHQSKEGWTPLHWAAHYGLPKTIDFLLQNGAVIKPDNYGRLPKVTELLEK